MSNAIADTVDGPLWAADPPLYPPRDAPPAPAAPEARRPLSGLRDSVRNTVKNATKAVGEKGEDSSAN